MDASAPLKISEDKVPVSLEQNPSLCRNCLQDTIQE